MLNQLNTPLETNPLQAIVEGEAIFGLIPQRPPMVMVDRFYGIDGNSSYAGLTIQTDNLFCQAGKLQETGILEHMAQSAAARIGYLYTERGEPVPLGFIGSIDKLTIHSLPSIDEVLVTEISVVQEVGDITLIAARVCSNEQLIAEGRMKIFLKKE